LLSLSRLVLGCICDATLAFAENGGVQAESKIGETLLAFLGTTESNKVFDLFCL